MLKSVSGGGGGPSTVSCISVIGMSAKTLPEDQKVNGVGKSCLCNRFVRPSQDDFRMQHISTVHEADFSGQVLRNSHWLYWGCVERRSGRLCHVVEQTEFVNDKDLRPFPASEPYYVRCSATKLYASQKLAWVCSDQLGFENDYPKQRAPDGSLLVGGFLVCVDLSQDLDRQIQFLQEVALVLQKTKRPALLVATKVDSCLPQQTSSNADLTASAMSAAYAKKLDILRKECRQFRCFVGGGSGGGSSASGGSVGGGGTASAGGGSSGGPYIVETSAALNINIDEAFQYLLALIEKDKSRMVKPGSFADAFVARRAQCESATWAYHRLLQSTMKRQLLFQSFSTWQSSHASCPEFLRLIELQGSPRAREEFDRHLHVLRREALSDRRSAIERTLRIFFERVVPDCSAAQRLAAMSWTAAVADMTSTAAGDPDAASCLVDTGQIAWHQCVAYLNSPEDARVPLDYLGDEIASRPVFEKHTDRLKAQQRTAELRTYLLLAMKASRAVRWGTPLDEVVNGELVPGWDELTAQLGPADVAKAYADAQASLERRALADLNEALMELSGYFYRPQTGRDTLAEMANQAWLTMSKRLDSQRFANLLDQRERLNDALLRHLQFVRGGSDAAACFYASACVDRLVPDVLNNCVGDFAKNSTATAASCEAESPILLLSTEQLTQRFKQSCRSLCQTQDSYRMGDRLYRLSFRSPRLNSARLSGSLTTKCRHDYIGCVLLYDSRNALANLQELAATAPLLLEAQQMLTVRTGSESVDQPESEYECLVPSASPSPAASLKESDESFYQSTNSTANQLASVSNDSSSSVATPPAKQLLKPNNSLGTNSEFRIIVAFLTAVPSAKLTGDNESTADNGTTNNNEFLELKSAGLRLASRLNAHYLVVEGGGGLAAADPAELLARLALEHLLPASFYRRTPDMLYLRRDACQLSLICVLACGDNLSVARERLARLVAAIAGGRSSACAYRGRSLAVELCSRRLLIRLASFHTAWRLCDSHAFHGALFAYSPERKASIACAETLASNISHRMPVTLIALGSHQTDGDQLASLRDSGVRFVQLDIGGSSWFADFANECLAAKDLTERRFQDRFPAFVAASTGCNFPDSFVSPQPPPPPQQQLSTSISQSNSPCNGNNNSSSAYYDCNDDHDDGEDDNSVYSSADSIGGSAQKAPIYSCPTLPSRPPLASQEICEVYADPPDARQLMHHRPKSSSDPVGDNAESTYAYTCNALPPGTYRLVNSRSDYCHQQPVTSSASNNQPLRDDHQSERRRSHSGDSQRQPQPAATVTVTAGKPNKSVANSFFNQAATIHHSLARLARLGYNNSNNNNNTTSSSQPHKVYLAVPAPPLTLADLAICTDSRQLSPADGPVPQLVVTCVEFVEREGGLRSEGVYRLCGNATETSAVMDLLLREPNSNLASLKPKPSICAVTSALKQLLMKLEPSLIPGRLLGGLLKVTSTPRQYPNFQPNVTYFLVNNLSQPALACLRYIVQHLHRISCHAADNRMTSANLAVCWIQTLLPASDPRISLAYQDQLQTLIDTLIRYPNLLNPLPVVSSESSTLIDDKSPIPPPLPSRRL